MRLRRKRVSSMIVICSIWKKSLWKLLPSSTLCSIIRLRRFLSKLSKPSRTLLDSSKSIFRIGPIWKGKGLRSRGRSLIRLSTFWKIGLKLAVIKKKEENFLSFLTRFRKRKTIIWFFSRIYRSILMEKLNHKKRIFSMPSVNPSKLIRSPWRWKYKLKKMSSQRKGEGFSTKRLRLRIQSL